MNSDTVVEIEPLHRRQDARRRGQLKQAELHDIAASEILVLATATARLIVDAMEMKERRRMRRNLLMITCGMAFLFGMARTVIYLIHN